MSSEDAHELDTTGLCEAFVGSSQDAFLALRHDGTVEFASEAVRTLLGYDPGEMVGHHVVDWLRGEEVERALLQLGSSVRRIARGVTRFSVQAADGNYVPIEVAASLFTLGNRELIGLCCRDGRDQAFIEDVMTRLLGGSSRYEVLQPVVNTIGWQAMGSKVVIEWLDESGRHSVTSGDFDDGLGGLGEGAEEGEEDPWSRARLTLEAQRGAVSDEVGQVRAVAESAGVDSYWVEPVIWSSQYPPAMVTVWTTTEFSTEVHTYGMYLARRLVELILRWTEHVPPTETAAS